VCDTSVRGWRPISDAGVKRLSPPGDGVETEWPTNHSGGSLRNRAPSRNRPTKRPRARSRAYVARVLVYEDFVEVARRSAGHWWVKHTNRGRRWPWLERADAESEACVALVRICELYDETVVVDMPPEPFVAQRVQWAMIDWHRLVYGRGDCPPPPLHFDFDLFADGGWLVDQEVIAEFERIEDHVMLAQMIDDLPERERVVMRGRSRGLRLADIADDLGLTEGRICQIEKQALARLAC